MTEAETTGNGVDVTIHGLLGSEGIESGEIGYAVRSLFVWSAVETAASDAKSAYAD